MAINNNSSAFDEDEQREKLVALSKALGVDSMRADIDSCIDNIGYLRKGFEELVKSWQEFNESMSKQQTQISQPETPTTTPVNTNSSFISSLPVNEKVGIMKEIMGSARELMLAWKEMRGNNTPTTIIDPEIINEHLRKSMMGNFEVGEALTETLKSKIVGRSMSKIVSDVISHEPA